jgi:hypothetical protein
MDERIKCRLCEWSALKGPDGNAVDRAFIALSNHISDEHWDLAEVLESIREDEEDEAAYIRSLHLAPPAD